LTSKEGADALDTIEVGRVKLDLTKLQAEINGNLAQLTRMESQLLYFLMSHQGGVFSAEELANQAFEGVKAKGGTPDGVQAHIRNIRQKIEMDPKSPEIVVTVGKSGYSFVG
jgi:DNA-binding response OmpR family regulator